MKKGILFCAAIFALIALINFGSAYPYYGGNFGYGNYYDSYSYSSSRSYGYFGMPSYTKTTTYHRENTAGWRGPDYITTTSYIRTTRESPRYNYGYGPMYYNYPTYNNYYYGNYPRYYGGYLY